MKMMNVQGKWMKMLAGKKMDDDIIPTICKTDLL